MARCSAHLLAHLTRLLDLGFLADVVGEFSAVALVVADGHPLPAAAADDQALQQGGFLAGRAALAVGAVGGSAFGQTGLAGVELRQSDVAGVSAGQEGDPVHATESRRVS